MASGVFDLSGRAAAGEIEPEQVQALRAALSDAYDTDPGLVRPRALESLAHFSPDPEVETAIADAYTTGDARLKLAALFAMGLNRAPRWFPILYEELQSPDPEIRNYAARSIGEYGDQQAVERLVTMVEDCNRQVQAAALMALADIGGDIAVAMLEKIAASDDFFLSQQAKHDLERIRASP